jgi:predicted nuclease of predicted toxin-antitoxin system
VKFLIDANLPPALANWLVQSGHEARHVDNVIPPPALDEAVWSLARERSFVIVSKDVDFVHLSGAQTDQIDPQVVWVRCGNLTLDRFRIWFEARTPEMLELLSAGERVVELR